MLDKDVLGLDLYNRAQAFNDVDITDLTQARKDYWATVAEGIINHFKENGVLTIPGLGLTAGAEPVTGESVTGTLS